MSDNEKRKPPEQRSPWPKVTEKKVVLAEDKEIAQGRRWFVDESFADRSSGRFFVKDVLTSNYEEITKELAKAADEIKKDLYERLTVATPADTVAAPADFVNKTPNWTQMVFGLNQYHNNNPCLEEELRLRDSVKDYLVFTDSNVSWDSIVGNEPAKQVLREAVEDPIKHAALFRYYGKKAPRGALLYGPPGCGKTMLAKAVATSVRSLREQVKGKPLMLSLKGASVQQKYVGATEQIIQNVFTYSRAYNKSYGHPLVVFIDEAEVMLPPRDDPRTYNYQKSNVAAFLAEMDGLEDSGAFVLLASNRQEDIDEAILRDGRCDRKVRVSRPDKKAARTLVTSATKKVPLSSEVTLQALVEEIINAVWGEHRHVARLMSEDAKGRIKTSYLLLRDIINGAMLVGLVEQVKSAAFQRDLRSGQMTGIRLEDVEVAVQSLVQQNAGLPHHYALTEYMQNMLVQQESEGAILH